jgi:hypothetical protein
MMLMLEGIVPKSTMRLFSMTLASYFLVVCSMSLRYSLGSSPNGMFSLNEEGSYAKLNCC